MKQREFKEKMPRSAAFVEMLVKTFGQEQIHGNIRAGLDGEPTFYACENEFEIGTRITHNDGITFHPVTGNAIDVQELLLEKLNAELLHPDDARAIEIRAHVKIIEWIGQEPSYPLRSPIRQHQRMPLNKLSLLTQKDKAIELRKFINVYWIPDGPRMVVGTGHKRGESGKHVATIVLTNTRGYELVMQMDNGETEHFRADQLHPSR